MTREEERGNNKGASFGGLSRPLCTSLSLTVSISRTKISSPERWKRGLFVSRWTEEWSITGLGNGRGKYVGPLGGTLQKGSNFVSVSSVLSRPLLLF